MKNERDRDIRARKRAKFAPTAPKSKRPVAVWVFGGVGLLLVGLLAWGLLANGVKDGAEAGGLPVRDGAVRLPVSTFDDGQARWYTYQADGVDIQFFVLKSSDGVIRAAFNACDVCFLDKKGYRQEGDEMVCNNCGQRFPSVLVNEVRGGCNPSPLTRTVEGDEVVILVEDILSGARYF